MYTKIVRTRAVACRNYVYFFAFAHNDRMHSRMAANRYRVCPRSCEPMSCVLARLHAEIMCTYSRSRITISCTPAWLRIDILRDRVIVNRCRAYSRGFMPGLYVIIRVRACRYCAYSRACTLVSCTLVCMHTGIACVRINVHQNRAHSRGCMPKLCVLIRVRA